MKEITGAIIPCSSFGRVFFKDIYIYICTHSYITLCIPELKSRLLWNRRKGRERKYVFRIKVFEDFHNKIITKREYYLAWLNYLYRNSSRQTPLITKYRFFKRACLADSESFVFFVISINNWKARIGAKTVIFRERYWDYGTKTIPFSENGVSGSEIGIIKNIRNYKIIIKIIRQIS